MGWATGGELTGRSEDEVLPVTGAGWEDMMRREDQLGEEGGRKEKGKGGRMKRERKKKREKGGERLGR